MPHWRRSGKADPRFTALVAQAGRPPLRRRPDGFPRSCRHHCGTAASTASANASGDGLPQHSIRSNPRPSCAPVRRGWRGSGCRRPKFARSRRSHVPSSATNGARRARQPFRRRGARGAHRRARHRPVDCRHLSAVLPRSRRCMASRHLALQEAARVAFGLPARPTAKEMQALADPWRPWRAIAAKILWTCYRAAAEAKAKSSAAKRSPPRDRVRPATSPPKRPSSPGGSHRKTRSGPAPKRAR